PFDEFADQVARAFDPADLVEGDEAGVPEPCRAARLAEESLRFLVRARTALLRDLEGDDAVQLGVDRPVDDPEGPASDHLLDRELAEPGDAVRAELDRRGEP